SAVSVTDRSARSAALPRRPSQRWKKKTPCCSSLLSKADSPIEQENSATTFCGGLGRSLPLGRGGLPLGVGRGPWGRGLSRQQSEKRILTLALQSRSPA